jgi:ankyrin repeat protein
VPLGFTPLFYASYYGHREIVECLLFNGADPVAEVCGRRTQTCKL